MKESKRQTMLLVGFALIVISAIMVYVSLSSPRVYDKTSESVSTKAQYSDSSESKSESAKESNNTENSSVSSAIRYPINLNTATVDELMCIDGIGEKRASDIIAYRQAVGEYKSVDEIKNIKGIGDSLYHKVAPYLTV